MEVNGYEVENEENENNKLLTLKEVTFVGTIEELDKLIQFLHHVKEMHSEHVQDGYCYSHYRDWDLNWKKGSPDIIVVSHLDEK